MFDLNAGMFGGGVLDLGRPGLQIIQPRNTWTPAKLFENSEVGGWFSRTDISTLFIDSAATTPATSVGDPVGKMLDKSGNGNHVTQINSTSRPKLTSNAINFDGVDDGLVLSTYPTCRAIFVKANFYTVTSKSYFIGGDDGGGSFNHGVRYNGSSFLIYTGNAIEEFNWAKVDLTVNFIANYINTGWDLYIGSSKIGTTTSHITSFLITSIGKRLDGLVFPSALNIKEVIFRDTKFTDAELAKLQVRG